jgi:hypothetical protein
LARDGFGRLSPAGWGTADLGGPWVLRFNGNTDAAAAASLDGARGHLGVTTTTGLKVLVGAVGPAAADADLRVTARADRAAGAYVMLVARVVDANRFYAAQINLGSNSFAVRRSGPVSNVWTTLGSGPTPATPFAANTDYAMRLQVQGTALRAKWWPAGQPEPSAWAVQVTDANYAAGQSGVAGVVTTSPTTVDFAFDDFAAAPLAGGASGASMATGASSPVTAASAVLASGSALVGDAARGLGDLWQRIRPAG